MITFIGLGIALITIINLVLLFEPGREVNSGIYSDWMAIGSRDVRLAIVGQMLPHPFSSSIEIIIKSILSFPFIIHSKIIQFLINMKDPIQHYFECSR